MFYVGLKAFVRRGDELLVLGDPIEGLDFPGGRIQIGELDIIESLKREVREETGIEVEVKNPFTTWINVFPPEHKLHGKKVFLVGYECEYISGEVTLSDEHDKFSWVTKDNFHEANDGTEWFEILEKYFK